MKKNFIGVILIVICFLTGCAANPMVALYNNDKAIASDTNTYNLDAVEQKINDGHFVANVERMEGMDTVWEFDTEEDIDINLIYKINVSSGKLKLVQINPKGYVSVITECDSNIQDTAETTLNVEKGNNRIKIVTDENTKFDIDLSIPEGDFKELG